MIENIQLSFQGIWSHKLRAFLTMLGIIVGIASLISVVSTIRGSNEQIKQNLIGSGNNVVRLQLYQDDYPYMYYEGLPFDISPVSDTTLEKLKGIKNSESLSLYNHRTEYSSLIYYKDYSLSTFDIYGIRNDYFSTCGYVLTQGRNFVPKDFSDYRSVMIIDSSAASALFPGEDPVGKTVEYKSMAFVVIGIVEETNTFVPSFDTKEEYLEYYSLKSTSSGKVYVPYTSWPDIFAYDDPESVVIRADTTDNMFNVGKEATAILNASHTNTSITYKAEDLLETEREIQELSGTTNNQLIGIASISLLVGGIGVMNIMLVSVTERTREIGLKKAIGAKKRRILWQFLTESAVLTTFGGILGIIVGIILSRAIASLAEIPVSISIPSIFIALVFSTVIGIVFGLVPSIKASNLNPIDALRHE